MHDTRQLKQWKQSCRIQTKKLQTLEKQFPKMLPFNMTTQLKPHIQSWLDDQQSKTNDRYKQELDIFNKLSAMKSGIEHLRETLKQYERKEGYILKIQNISESIIGSMDMFKGSMAKEYEKWAGVQDGLVKELEMMDIKVNQYEKGEIVVEEPINKQKTVIKPKPKLQQPKPQVKPNDNQSIHTAILAIQDQMKELTKQVQHIDFQMRSFGKNLGWIEQDHNDFILLWNRRKNNNYFQFSEECFHQLKTYTMDQIKIHFDKHQKNLELFEKRRELLYQYKLKKEKKRELELELVERKEKQERQEVNRGKREVERIKEEKETKEKLQFWKMMKQSEKQAIQKEKQLQQQRKKLQIAERKKKVEQKKSIVSQWRQQKQINKQKQTKSQLKRPQSAVNKQTLERIKKKQDELLMKKMDILRSKQQKQQQKIHKQQIQKQKKFVQYNYVKSKLDEQTTAIKQKQRSKFDGTNPKDAETFGGNLGILHGRAVPTWRQGI